MKNFPIPQMVRQLCTAAFVLVFSTGWRRNVEQGGGTGSPYAQSSPPRRRINGPAIFGVRPGNPFLYHVPATGDRPMKFSIQNLPSGLLSTQIQGGSAAQRG